MTFFWLKCSIFSTTTEGMTLMYHSEMDWIIMSKVIRERWNCWELFNNAISESKLIHLQVQCSLIISIQRCEVKILSAKISIVCLFIAVLTSDQARFVIAYLKRPPFVPLLCTSYRTCLAHKALLTVPHADWIADYSANLS